MKTSYEADVVAWANEQAAFVRAGRLDMMDLEHIAEEIEDVGKSEKREISSRMAVLLMHLLKWQHQKGRRGNSWMRTIKEQRKAILECLNDTPSLKAELEKREWWVRTWADTVSKTIEETGIDELPENCPWSVADILTMDWLPE